MDQTTIDRLLTDPDFIVTKRFGNSLEKLLERYPDEVPPRYIAQALGISELDLDTLYAGMLEKLRTSMKVEV